MRRVRGLSVVGFAIGLFVSTSGCGGTDSSQLGDPDASTGDNGSSGGGNGSSGSVFGGPNADASSGPCSAGGLGCLVPAGCTTSISGTVYDPAGVNPLYNVAVYVPNDPAGALPPIKSGTNSCSSCDVSIGNYVAATTSGADGTFTLKGVPATTHVPLVVQIGKWRREIFLPQVKACTDNVLTKATMARLPARRSEGNIPQMALVTGGADNLGCFLTGIGLDPGEYSAPHGGGRLDIYKGQGRGGGGGIFGGGGGGGAPGLSKGGTAGDCTSDNASCVWNSKANLEAYDIVLLACEGDTFDPDESNNRQTNKTAGAKQALHDWLDEGGKVFSTHFHYTWFKNSPQADFKGVATWLGNSGGSDAAKYAIDSSFPKGKVFDSWLGKVGGAAGGQIALTGVAESVGAVSASTQRWIYNPATDPQNGGSNNTKYLSFLTPIGGIPNTSGAPETNGPQYCGKAVFSDLHAGGMPVGDIPGVCAGPPLSAQLKALEFLFFDLSACVSNDSLPPPDVPPPTK